MIFITLGTQSCDFSRCLKMVEDMVIEYGITEEIVAQTGHTKYKPSSFRCVDFVSEEKYQDYIENSSVVISHAGTGALFSSIKKGKKIIAVARLKQYGEMLNDHQVEIVRKLSESGYILDGTNSVIDAWKQLQSFIPKVCDFECSLPLEIGKLIDSWFLK